MTLTAAMLTVGLAFIGSAIISIALNLIASELFGWCPRWSDILIRKAAEKIPPEHRERFIEETIADLDRAPRTTALWRLIQASTLYLWGAKRIASDLVETPSATIGSREGVWHRWFNAASFADRLWIWVTVAMSAAVYFFSIAEAAAPSDSPILRLYSRVMDTSGFPYAATVFTLFAVVPMIDVVGYVVFRAVTRWFRRASRS